MKLQSLVQLKWYRNLLAYILQVSRQEFIQWSMAFLMAIPGGTGSVIRTYLIQFKSIGRNCRIMSGSTIEYPWNLSIGHSTQINRGCVIHAGGGIQIGTNVLIGPGVVLYSQNHCYKDGNVPISYQGWHSEKVIIEDDVWLCARAIVLPGVRVATGTVVAAGAVVTHDTEAYSICAGVPAKAIAHRLRARNDEGNHSQSCRCDIDSSLLPLST